MARKDAREAAMKILYQWDMLGEYKQVTLDDLALEFSLEDRDLEYIKDILDGFVLQKDKINKIIADRTKGWTLDRLSKVDLAILRLALYEIIYRSDIPDSVSINEGVELAKKYGNEKSGAFINGVLGQYIRQDKDKMVDDR
ncbi:MAG: transcription antitermination factor NusB [Caldicoprobacterales bacterium]|jgi:N utilization substance protein B|nr:transcription antitermination factor NusB [Bacillota bacterium]NLH59049.1 transcription antitermination factor NusB [Clostridiales bacterium]